MQRLILISATALSICGTGALAADYPILQSYQAQAEKLVAMTKAAKSQDDLIEIQTADRELISLGTQIMNLYGQKNPNCQAQFSDFLKDLSTMEFMPIDQVHKKYHDAVGLPEAPRHCYFGRSEIVHPVMNLIRLKGTWNDQARDEVIDDFQEVIEHLPRIQKNLDNPPN